MRTVYRAAVIGLGNIGFKFDLDPKRRQTWTHVKAYQRCPQTKLVAAVDPDSNNQRLFKQRYPGIAVYRTIAELFEHQDDLDIVSIAVPTRAHEAIVREVCRHRVKAIFCEKPLTSVSSGSIRLCRLAQRKRIVLAVNYSRRWQSSFQWVREKITAGAIGRLTTVHAFYPGQIYNIGSHLIDTILMLSSVKPTKISAFGDTAATDPSLSALIECQNGVTVSFSVTGKREDLIFEIDLIGTEGRISISDNGERIAYGKFQRSKRYSGYRELVPQKIKYFRKNDRFVDAVRNIVGRLNSHGAPILCTGEDALAVDRLIEKALRSARRKGIPLKI